MEYLKKVLNKSGWISIFESIIFALVGVILIAHPDGMLKAISLILGVIFISFGIFKIFNYISQKDNSNYYNYDIIYGVIAIIIGIITIAFSTTIGSLLRIIIGIWIIYSACIRMVLSMKLKAQGLNIWVYTLVISLIMFACGLYVTFNAGAIITTIGILMITSSVLDIIEDLIFMRNVKELL